MRTDDNRDVPFLDELCLFSRPFFHGAVGIGIRDVSFEALLGLVEGCHARLELLLLFLKFKRAHHAVIEIHHHENKDNNANNQQNPPIGPIYLFNFFPKLLHMPDSVATIVPPRHPPGALKKA